MARAFLWVAVLLLAFHLGASDAAAQTGWGLGVVGDDFYFTDLTRGRVVRLDSAGRVHVLLVDVHCHNFAPGYDGYIYGEAVGTNRGGTGAQMAVWRLSSSGEHAWVMPPTTALVEGVWIARDGSGNTYMWHGEPGRSSRIVRRAPTGEVVMLAGGAWGHADGLGPRAQFGQVGGLAVTPAGVVYLVDSGHLRRIALDGSVETLARSVVSPRSGGVPGRADLFNHSVGLAVSADEVVYIADHYNRRVVRWDSARGDAVIWESPAGWLSRLTLGGIAWYPGGVAVAGPDVYVLEVLPLPGFAADLVGSPRIRRISPDAASTFVATVASMSLRLVVVGLFLALALGIVVWLRRR